MNDYQRRMTARIRRVRRRHPDAPTERFWEGVQSCDWLAMRRSGFLELIRQNPEAMRARARLSFIDGQHPRRVLPLPEGASR